MRAEGTGKWEGRKGIEGRERGMEEEENGKF